METPGDVFESSNEYSILYENKKYLVKFEIISDSILFTVYNGNKNNKTINYLHQSKLENLRNHSKILKLYTNNSEIISLVDELFKNKKIYLDTSENNDLNLVIQLEVLTKEEILLLPLEKQEDILINNNTNLSQKDMSKEYNKLKKKLDNITNKYKEQFNNFEKEIKLLKEENNELKNKVFLLSKEIEELNNIFANVFIENSSLKNSTLSNSNNNIFLENLIKRIEILEGNNNNNNKNVNLDESSRSLLNSETDQGINVLLKTIKKKEKRDLEKLKQCFYSNSTILNKDDNIFFIINRLSKFNPISYDLIFKSSIDGDDITNFHKKCDGVNNIIIFIETSKGYKFGGFTSIGFDSSGYELNDNNAFLFSIDKQKIYNIISGNNAIYCNKKCGPIFCAKRDSSCYNIYIPDYFLSNKSMTTKKSYCYEMDEVYELNFGEKDFLVKELEIFKINTISC